MDELDLKKQWKRSLKEWQNEQSAGWRSYYRHRMRWWAAALLELKNPEWANPEKAWLLSNSVVDDARRLINESNLATLKLALNKEGGLTIKKAIAGRIRKLERSHA